MSIIAKVGTVLARQSAAIEAAREALQRIADGNPGRPRWLADVEMADIAREALKALEE